MDIGSIIKPCDECSGTGFILDDDMLPPAVEVEKPKDTTRSEKMKASWAKRKANDKDMHG
jgi:hypothetical protein